MHLLLIRHGETEHNVARLLVGVTDSRLTNHGFAQAELLGKALIEKRGLKFNHIFASTLQRAWITAGEIQKQQNIQYGDAPEVVQVESLKEQDFGGHEMSSWNTQRAKDAINPNIPDPDEPGFKPRETVSSVRARADKFVDECLIPLLNAEIEGQEDVVAVVSHGLYLQQLWKAIFVRFTTPDSVSVGPDAILIPGQSIGDVRKWGNTGYLECSIHPNTMIVSDAKIADASPTVSPVDIFAGKGLKVLAINQSDHVENLKSLGTGSSPYDPKQQSIKGFFQKSQT